MNNALIDRVLEIVAILGVIAVISFFVIFFVDVVLSIIDGSGLFKKNKQTPQAALPSRPTIEASTGNTSGTGRVFEPRNDNPINNQPAPINISVNSAAIASPVGGKEESEAERERRLIEERFGKKTEDFSSITQKEEIKTKTKNFFDFIDEEDDEEEEPAPKKPAPAKNTKPSFFGDEEEEVDFFAKKPAPKKPAVVEDDENDDMDERRQKVLEILSRINSQSSGKKDNNIKDNDTVLINNIAGKSASEIISQEHDKHKDELAVLRAEMDELKNKIKEEQKTSGKNSEEVAVLTAEREAVKDKIDAGRREIEELRAALEAEKAAAKREQERAKQLEEEFETFQQEALVTGKKLAEKEAQLLERQTIVHYDVKTLSADERRKLIDEYEKKAENLRERLRVNERELRRNSPEYIRLRRIKNTLERDKKLLRKREAHVAKQQVLVYGVNNKMNLDPERIKKLEEDTQQLEGLQKSVMQCEEIMYKNRDRYPTLENMYNILMQQNKNLKEDIEQSELMIQELVNANNNK